MPYWLAEAGEDVAEGYSNELPAGHDEYRARHLSRS